jgi:hypothetical protein
MYCHNYEWNWNEIVLEFLVTVPHGHQISFYFLRKYSFTISVQTTAAFWPDSALPSSYRTHSTRSMSNCADIRVLKWEFSDLFQAAISAPWFGKINDRNVRSLGTLFDRQAKLFKLSRNIIMTHSRLTVALITDIRGDCCEWHVSVGTHCEDFLCGRMPVRSVMGYACHVFGCTLDIYTLITGYWDLA